MRNQRLSLFFLGLLAAFISLSFRTLPQSQTNGAEITFPGNGNAVQGLVQIIGSANISGFQSYRLEFASSTATAPAWFLITQQSTPVNNDILGEWDTSILTDGDYTLKLTVNNGTDQPVTFLIEDIRIRNYSPIETDTPAPTSQELIATPSTAPTDTPTPTTTQLAAPTEASPNSISISGDNIKRAILVGGILGLFGTLFVILYAGYRQKH
ncbi:hypothetical protein KQH54_02640 [bacterium]|nr:hypothetical protein [bacterium]